MRKKKFISFIKKVKIFSFYFQFRRKPGNSSSQNKHTSAAGKSNIDLDDKRRSSTKLSLPARSSLPHKEYNHSTNQDIPPALPPRKPLDKKNSAQMLSTTQNSSPFSNNSFQISSNTVDDTSLSLLTPRPLPNKEVSR